MPSAHFPSAFNQECAAAHCDANFSILGLMDDSVLPNHSFLFRSREVAPMSNLIRKSTAAAAGAVLMTFTLASLAPTIGAQEAPKSTKAKKSAGKTAKSDEEARPGPPDATHRVPAYFGGLGLSDEQKEAIYAVAAKYQPQIQDLEKKADALRDRQLVESENILTAPQKKALVEARKAAAERRKSARKAEPEAQAEEKAEPESKKAEPKTRKPAAID